MKFTLENAEEQAFDLSPYFPSAQSQIDEVRLKHILTEVEEWV
jgi:hypothetical protein